MTTIARQTSTSRTALFALALLACAFAVGATFSVTVFSGDYGVNLPVSADNAGPAVMALLHGDIGAFAAHQPVMGLGSLLLRLPLAGLAQATGGGDLSIYRLGGLACLLPCVLFVTWLGAIGRRSPIGLAVESSQPGSSSPVRPRPMRSAPVTPRRSSPACWPARR